jgi:cytochrome c oxidase subunit 2
LKKNVSTAVLSCVVVLCLAPAGARDLGADQAAPKRFEVTASRYAFEPSVIEVEQGDVVDLVVRSADTEHGLGIDAFKVKVKVPKGGESVAVSFVASRPGTFPIKCSEYCGSGHRRMRGQLVVAEKAQ